LLRVLSAFLSLNRSSDVRFSEMGGVLKCFVPVWSLLCLLLDACR
jgi:hypothetical protein